MEDDGVGSDVKVANRILVAEILMEITSEAGKPVALDNFRT